MIPTLLGWISSCLFITAANAQSNLTQASALQPFYGKPVGTLEIQGIKRIEKEAVTAKLSLKPGKTITREAAREDIQNIFKMGFFDDIDLRGESSGNAVNVTLVVHERPVISKIEFEGNERLGTTDLKEVIKVKEWSILDVNRVREDVALIQKHYEDKGFYLAKVSFEVKSVKPDEVELVYKVSDYDKVQIKKITFLNNRRFSDNELKGVFAETKEGGLFSFLSSSGNFKESSFKQDLQRLTYFYLDHGYVKFRYENPIVTISDDKKYLFITLYLDEGEQYSLGAIDFGGDLLFGKETLHEDLSLKTNDIFSISKRNADIQKLTERYQDLGYAFTNVIPKMNFHDEARTVDIEYDFEKGSLVYFNEINILGNTKTHDKVIRRELKIHEGELYSGTRLRQSRENVERLGFFSPGEVIFNTTTPKGKPDLVNVDITVKERSTGTITLGAGYGSVQKFFFTTQISEINLFGRGQNLSLSSTLAADTKSKSFNLGFTDPYAFDTRWSMGFDAYFVNFVIPNKYNTRKLGFDIRMGYPIAEYTSAYITYKHEGLQALDVQSTDLIDEVNRDSGVLSSIIWSIVRDKRNNRFETTDGNYQSVSVETAKFLGGTKHFFKTVLNNRFYKRLVGDLVFRNNLEFGHMWNGGDRDDRGNVLPLPPSEKFYLGGPNNLRGYNVFMVGPTKTLTEVTTGNLYQEPLGGAVEMLGQAEFEYPLIREAGLKFVTFFDAGNVYDNFPGFNKVNFLTDVGLGFRWFSPIGPLRFEWGFPLNRRVDSTGKYIDDSSQFTFFIGPPF